MRDKLDKGIVFQVDVEKVIETATQSRKNISILAVLGFKTLLDIADHPEQVEDECKKFY